MEPHAEPRAARSAWEDDMKNQSWGRGPGQSLAQSVTFPGR